MNRSSFSTVPSADHLYKIVGQAEFPSRQRAEINMEIGGQTPGHVREMKTCVEGFSPHLHPCVQAENGRDVDAYTSVDRKRSIGADDRRGDPGKQFRTEGGADRT